MTGPRRVYNEWAIAGVWNKGPQWRPGLTVRKPASPTAIEPTLNRADGGLPTPKVPQALSPSLATTPIAMSGMLRQLPRWLMDPLGPLHIQPRYLPRALPWLIRFARETAERRVRHNARALNALNRDRPAGALAGVEHLIELSVQLYLFRSRADYERNRLGKEPRDATGQTYEVIGHNAIRDLELDLAPIY